jgi:hypothetical protein
MKPIYRTLGLITLFLLLLAACAPDANDRGAPAVTQESVYEGILENMRAAGADVELEEDVSQPLVPADTRLFRINGELVQIMVFTDEVTRSNAENDMDLRSGLIPETGDPDNPQNLYYWSSGQTVAMYVGNKQEVIDTVTAALGEPVTVNQSGSVEDQE